MQSVRPVFIAIAGGSGSGKTSLATQIAAKYDGAIISQDWYYKSVGEGTVSHNWDHPTALDHRSLRMSVAAWCRGMSQVTPRHNYATGQSVSHELLPPRPVMILEGIHAFYDADTVDRMDLKIFVSCDEATALARRIARDMAERGYTEAEIRTDWAANVAPAFDNWIAPRATLADCVIGNLDIRPYAPGTLDIRPYAPGNLDIRPYAPGTGDASALTPAPTIDLDGIYTLIDRMLAEQH